MGGWRLSMNYRKSLELQNLFKLLVRCRPPVEVRGHAEAEEVYTRFRAEDT